MKRPLVSILIPCYNAEKFLAAAISSVINQTYEQLEIIIIDDNSSDNSSAIYEAFASKDKRIKIIRKSKNTGAANALNKGIDLASGSYIARMDADDLSEKNRIEKQVEYLIDNPHIGVLGSRAMIIDEEGNNLHEVGPMYFENNTLSFSTYFSQPFVGGAIIGKAEVFKTHPFRPQSISEDYELWLRLVSKGIKIENIDAQLYKYRINAGSMSMQNDSGQKSSHNESSHRYLEELSGEKMDKTLVSIINNRPSKKVTFSEYKKSIRLFRKFYINYKGEKTEELDSFYHRQKFDISFQAFKRSQGPFSGLFILSNIFVLSLNIKVLNYILHKISPPKVQTRRQE